MLKDFVPMIKAAWNSICEPERHKMCLKTCGYVPFTMAPAFKMLAEEKAREVEGQGVAKAWSGRSGPTRTCARRWTSCTRA